MSRNILNKRIGLILILGFSLLALMPSGKLLVDAQGTTCDLLNLSIVAASVTSSGTLGNGHSFRPSISGDGRYVAFMSRATNLVPGDNNGYEDIFVYDQVTGQTTRVSVASNGTEGNGNSDMPSISADGRYVAFHSLASNLVPIDTNNATDVFVHDQVTGLTSRVSIASDGTQSFGVRPSISADGRYVAFQSSAVNLVPNDTNGDDDVFVHDRVTGETTRVSVASDGTEGTWISESPAISSDGRFVTFVSGASNLVPNDNNGFWDVFVHDQVTGQTTRVSVASDGTEGNNHSQGPQSISADGRYIAFMSPASNLIPDDTNGDLDIFVHDRVTGQTSRVSIDSDGTEASGQQVNPSISADGRYVAFRSGATNLDPRDTNGEQDIFVYDRSTGQTTLVLIDSDGCQANGGSDLPAISGDGQYVAFESWATNLVSGDTLTTQDIFIARVVFPTTPPPGPIDISVEPLGTFVSLDQQGNTISVQDQTRAFLKIRIRVTRDGSPVQGANVRLVTPTQISFPATNSDGISERLVSIPPVPEIGGFSTEVEVTAGDTTVSSGPVDLFSIEFAGTIRGLPEPKTITATEANLYNLNLMLAYEARPGIPCAGAPSTSAIIIACKILKLIRLVSTIREENAWVAEAGDTVFAALYRYQVLNQSPAYVLYLYVQRGEEFIYRETFWTETPPAESALIAREALVVELASPATIYLTDPSGRSAGVNPTSGDLEFGYELAISDMGDEPYFAVVPTPLEGEYTLFVTGTGSGQYMLNIYAINDDGFPTIPVQFNNLTQLGETVEFIISYDREIDITESLLVTLNVEIDIKPDDDDNDDEPNTINLGSQGTIPTAILSTTAFDATTVNPMTITLTGAPVAQRRGRLMFSFEDVNDDELEDLVVHFQTQALQLTEADTQAVLEGETFAGIRIRGVDSVRVVPPRAPRLRDSEYPTFRWRRVEGAVCYQIQIDDNADFSSPIQDATVDGTRYDADQLPNGQYYWHVRVGGNCVNVLQGPWSETGTFTVPSDGDDD